MKTVNKKLPILSLSEVAHELKTPLTTINGYGQLLKSKFDKDSKEGGWAREIVKEAERLREMIDTLLK